MNDRVDGDGSEDEASGEYPRALQSLLELQGAQLAALRSDGQERLNELSEAFKVMAGALREDTVGAEGDAHVKVSADAIVQTLQFADNQAQRLEHLIRALDQMSSLVASSDGRDTAAWSALRAGMRADYTMARECEVFDGLFGPPRDPAPYAQQAAAASEPTIELF